MALVAEHDNQELRVFLQEIVEPMVGGWEGCRVSFERLHIHSGPEHSATRSLLHFSLLGLDFHEECDHRKGGDVTVARHIRQVPIISKAEVFDVFD